MNLQRYGWVIIVLMAAVMLSACGEREDGEREEIGGMPVPEAPARKMDAQQLALGQQVFQANCATCHGVQAEGDKNWRQRDADGHFPAPPLNGSGHAWHHSLEALKTVILDGSPNGKGKMPAWNGKLNDQQIEAAMAWFQSQWPQPVYDAWYEMQQRGR